LTLFSVVDIGGGGVVVAVVPVVVVVVVVVVLAGPLDPPPHAVVITPIAVIATAPTKTGKRRFNLVGFIMYSCRSAAGTVSSQLLCRRGTPRAAAATLR
jgi:hypothetical protein